MDGLTRVTPLKQVDKQSQYTKYTHCYIRYCHKKHGYLPTKYLENKFKVGNTIMLWRNKIQHNSKYWDGEKFFIPFFYFAMSGKDCTFAVVFENEERSKGAKQFKTAKSHTARRPIGTENGRNGSIQRRAAGEMAEMSHYNANQFWKWPK